MAIRFALDPEFTRSELRTPRNAANSFWNVVPSCPSVSQKSSVLLTASTSSSVNTQLVCHLLRSSSYDPDLMLVGNLCELGGNIPV